MKLAYTIIFTLGCLFSSGSYAMETRANLTEKQYEQLEKLIKERNKDELQSFLQEQGINEGRKIPRIEAHKLLPQAEGIQEVDTKQLSRAESKVTDPIAVGLLGAAKCVLGLICFKNAEKLDTSWIANLAGVSLYAKGLSEMIQPHKPSKEKKRIEEKLKRSKDIFLLLKKVSQSRCPQIYVDGTPHLIDIVKGGSLYNFNLNIMPQLGTSTPRQIEAFLYAARLQDTANLIHREETLTKKRLACGILNLNCLYGKLLALGLPKIPFPEPPCSIGPLKPLVKKLPNAPFIKKGIGREEALAFLTVTTSGALRLVGGELPPTVKKTINQALLEEVADVTDVSLEAYAWLQDICIGRPSLAIVKKLEDHIRDNKTAFDNALQKEIDQRQAAATAYVQQHPTLQTVTTENRELRIENGRLRPRQFNVQKFVTESQRRKAQRKVSRRMMRKKPSPNVLAPINLLN